MANHLINPWVCVYLINATSASCFFFLSSVFLEFQMKGLLIQQQSTCGGLYCFSTVFGYTVSVRMKLGIESVCGALSWLTETCMWSRLCLAAACVCACLWEGDGFDSRSKTKQQHSIRITFERLIEAVECRTAVHLVFHYAVYIYSCLLRHNDQLECELSVNKKIKNRRPRWVVVSLYKVFVDTVPGRRAGSASGHGEKKVFILNYKLPWNCKSVLFITLPTN